MSPVSILLIDDEPQIRRLLRNALTSTTDGDVPDVRVLEATTAREGIDIAAAESPALVVLDLGLPDLPGIDVCREIRQWSLVPILVLSARHAEAEKVALLDAGADDYLTKPFRTREFLARVRAQLRRASAPAPGRVDVVITLGDVTIDLQRRRVERARALIHLTPTEYGAGSRVPLRARPRIGARRHTSRQVTDVTGQAGNAAWFARWSAHWRARRSARLWTGWLATLAAATLGMSMVRDHLDKAHVTLVFLLIVLLGSAAGGRSASYSRARHFCCSTTTSSARTSRSSSTTRSTGSCS